MAKVISQKYEIHARADTVWDALVNPETIELWGGGPCKMSGKENAEFELWGGDIHGKNIEVVKNKILKQEWYGGDWEKPSIAIFELMEKDGKTIVTLTNTGVPEEEIDSIADGWDRYYIGEIKKLLEK